MRGSIDYSWAIGLVALILIVVFWKPMVGAFTGMKNKAGNKEGIDRGKLVFYDTERWGGEVSYKSCAMCHAADFTPDPTKKVTMPDYVPGKPLILKGMRKKYSNVLSGGDELFQEVQQCMTATSRLQAGKVSPNTPYMADLIAYVRSL